MRSVAGCTSGCQGQPRIDHQSMPAGGFVYHQGAIFGGLVGPILAYLATSWNIGFAIPMLIGTTVGCVSLIMAILFSPETRGKVLVADLQVA
jgi:MFS transporter, SHS family, lactate transporter